MHALHLRQVHKSPHAGVVVFVYLGSVAGSVGEVLSGRVQPPPGLAIAGVAASAVAIFASGYLTTVHARRAIQRCAPPQDTLLRCNASQEHCLNTGPAHHAFQRCATLHKLAALR